MNKVVSPSLFQPLLKLKITPDYKTFYNVSKPLSYDYLNFYLLLGGRGIGKTTGLLIRCISEYRKKGEEFAYVRRYETELKKAKNVFSKISDNITTRGLGKGAFEYCFRGKRIGYGLALSTQQTLKSGLDGSKVTNIIFDEAFLPPKSPYRYLNNEVEMLFELISTLVRERSNYKVWVVGNNLDLFNPYFSYFNIPMFETIYVDNERGLYIEKCPTKEDLLRIEMTTPLYKLTKGTSYGEYHYNNAVLVTEKGALGVKDINATLICRILYNNITLNIYGESRGRLFVEFRDKIIKDDKTFVIMEDNKPNYLYIKDYKQSNIKKFIDICYYENDVSYNDSKAISVFNTFMELFKTT